MKGKDHAKVALILYGGAVAGAWSFYLSGRADIALGLAGGGFTGWLLTPDIDVNGTTYEEYRLYKLFWPLGFIWQNFWSPYGLIFAHRGWSHTPFIGTLTRAIYVLLATFLAMLTYNEFIRFAGYNHSLMVDQFILFRLIFENRTTAIVWYVMWVVQDVGHYLADIISTAAKKEARKAVRKGENW